MNDEKNTGSDLPEVEERRMRTPSLLRNYISFVGMAIVVACLTSIILLFLIELSSHEENAYIGILTYIILPSIMMFGIFVAVVGMINERRRRRTAAPDDILQYPMLDLNDAHTRRSAMIFLIVTFIFVSASAFGSYRAFEYTESVSFCGEMCHEVMKPEFVSYLAGAHARVRCVDCHVGSGADWYVRSKLSGAYQLYSVTFNKFSRPIGTPVHSLRPAPDTCEQCHWPEKFFGAQMKVFNRYGNDEKNSLHELRMLLNVGGGSPSSGQVTGIHWHMNIANEIEYFSLDERRQEIPWVRIKDRDGNVTEYFDKTMPVSEQQIASASKRKMDCVDCHNRPAHVYLPPDVAVDQAFTAGKLDPTLPFLKRQSIAVLSGQYSTVDEALNAIETGLDNYYRQSYADVYAQKSAQVKQAIEEIKRIYQTYFFPEMKTDWKTHPNNIGHIRFPGCFRCHDGNKQSKSGKVITADCNVCHTIIYDSNAPKEQNVQFGGFHHPVDLGALETKQCGECHVPDKPFRHPVNLGDISSFQCVVCHPRR